MTCKWYDVCPVKRFYEQGKISKKYVDNYCKSKNNYLNCKRYQLEEKGIYHSDNLLPDGTYLDSQSDN